MERGTSYACVLVEEAGVRWGIRDCVGVLFERALLHYIGAETHHAKRPISSGGGMAGSDPMLSKEKGTGVVCREGHRIKR